MNARRLIALGMGLAIAGAAARAQGVLSYYSQFPAVGLANADWSETLDLPGFDSNLGTLTQVTLNYSGEVLQTIDAENTAGAEASYDLASNAALAVYNAGGLCLFDPGPINLHRAGTLSAFDGALDFAGTSGVGFQQDTRTTDSLNDPNLGAYIDAGVLHFLASATDAMALSSGGDSVNGGSTSAAVRLGVTYAFTPIPEPAAYAALLGLFVLGYVAIHRRQRCGPAAGS